MWFRSSSGIHTIWGSMLGSVILFSTGKNKNEKNVMVTWPQNQSFCTLLRNLIMVDCMEIVFHLVTIEVRHLMCRCVWNLKFVVEKKTNLIHSHIKCQLAFHDVYRYLFCFPKCLNQNHCQSTALMGEVQRLLFIISWNLIEL